jgi:hypothetical protein
MYDLQTLVYSLLGAALIAALAIVSPHVPRWRDWIVARYMSSSAGASADDDARTDRSIDRSAPTSLRVQTGAASVTGLEPAQGSDLPGLDAENTGLDGWPAPRVSRYLSDDEFITFLATQRLRTGKYRLSANKIVAAVGGDRTRVLAIINQVRKAPAEYLAPLSAAQQQVRDQLQLDRQ